MKTTANVFAAALLLLATTTNTLAATHYVDLNSTNATPPYTNWTTAATNGAGPGGIILSWPTNNAGYDYTGFTLQSTTNLGSPLWTTNSPAPMVVIAGQNTITNPISGAQKFFRLVH